MVYTACFIIREVELLKIGIGMDGYSVVKAFLENGQSFRSSIMNELIVKDKLLITLINN